MNNFTENDDNTIMPTHPAIEYQLDKKTMKKIADFVADHPDDVSDPAPTIEACTQIIVGLKIGWNGLMNAIARRDWDSDDGIHMWMEVVEAYFHDYKNFCVPVGDAPDNDVLGFWKYYADFRFHFLLSSFNTDFEVVDRDAWLDERLKVLQKEIEEVTLALNGVLLH